jgi:hypothetical protein
VTDILTDDEISPEVWRKNHAPSPGISLTSATTAETKGYIKRSSQPPSMQDILYEITDAGKAALRAVGGVAE